jgi:catechol 2,3-dioxygenase-like lactoylglutathione lyase family enzyme
MARKKSVVNSTFMSHGTLGSTDLEATRKFYEAFLGLEIIRTSKVSMMVRLGGEHVYAVVQQRQLDKMPRINHNGIDVPSDSDVDAAHAACLEQQEKWGLTGITKPIQQHGTYSFHFSDNDDNAWEILSNPQGGYTWIFEQGDQEGRGHWDKNFRQKLVEIEAGHS